MIIEKHAQKHNGIFEKIWVNWLKNSMNLTPETIDLNEIRNPYNSYIKSGGMVFYAIQNNECVGVVAVKKINLTDYEFSKLVVSEKARGLGIGKKLVNKCIDFVKTQNGSVLYLQSFHKLDIALSMYCKMGFKDTEPPQGMKVRERTEIIMKMQIQ